MKVLVTGSAGFIGSALTLRLLERGDQVLGLDNLNDYYSVALKQARLVRNHAYADYQHAAIDLHDRAAVAELFRQYQPQRVVNLAAQPGVRYAVQHPHAYVDSNLIGFMNILEGCRHHHVEHLVFASTSSVYGANTHMPYSVHDGVDHPLSLYAATKKANELMAHSYAHLYQLPCTGLRFFTVYGPWGRPDMAPLLFTRKILAGEPIEVFNYGRHRRDFTYIDDIVEGVIRTLDHPAQSNPHWSGTTPDPASSHAPYRIYNIGNQQPVELMDFIQALEHSLGRKAELRMLPLQAGDVPDTHADVEDLVREFDYRPNTSIQQGVARLVEWYTTFYPTPSTL